MAIQKVFSSLSKKANISTYVSISANVVYAESLVPTLDNVYSIGTDSLRWNHIHLGDGGIYFDGAYSTPQTVPYLPSAVVSSLVPAYTTANLSLGSSTNRWGDVWVGPYSVHLQDQTTRADVAMAVDNGTLYLNGAQNLAVGNLVINDTTLTSKTPNLDISIGATDDTGYFYVKRKTQFNNTTWSGTEAMVSINGSGAAAPATVFTDTLVQVVSRPDKNSRIVQRAYGSVNSTGGNNSYAVWASYAARGNVASPQAIKANDILSRVSSNGYGTTTWGSGGTRIESVAEENFTDSAKGSRINFWTTPVGSIVSQLVASVNSIGLVANGVQFTTDSTVQTTAGIPLTQKGVATGVATLGVDGRLTNEQIPSSLTGAITFQGGWNAYTNTPALANGTGTTGYQYIVTTPGNRNLGAGNVAYASGDTITYGGGVWNYTQSASPISSVSGNLHMVVGPTTGAVVIGVDATPNATNGTIVSRDASGNFQANTITAALSGQATSAITAATVTSGAQSAITSVGTLTSLAVTGNVTTGNVSGTKGTFTTVDATLSASTQAAITNVGTLGSLAVTGNVTAANVLIGTTVYANSSITSTSLASDFTIGFSAATGNLILNRNVNAVKSVLVSGNIRYDQTQNNATVTQQTNKSTAVTCNGRTGQITTNGAALNKGVAVQFTVNNTYITSAKDVVIVNIASGATVGYDISVNSVNAAGSFIINLHNSDSTPSGANASDTLVINFAIIKVN
jgi:hypothetical protein